MNCPNCGHAAPPTHTARCGHCNYKLPGNPKPQAAKPGATVTCWNCRHPNAAEAERCEHCNAKVRASEGAKTPVAPRPGNRQYFNIASHDE